MPSLKGLGDERQTREGQQRQLGGGHPPSAARRAAISRPEDCHRALEIGGSTMGRRAAAPRAAARSTQTRKGGADTRTIRDAFYRRLRASQQAEAERDSRTLAFTRCATRSARTCRCSGRRSIRSANWLGTASSASRSATCTWVLRHSTVPSGFWNSGQRLGRRRRTELLSARAART